MKGRNYIQLGGVCLTGVDRVKLKVALAVCGQSKSNEQESEELEFIKVEVENYACAGEC